MSVIALLCLGALYQYGAEVLDNYRYPAPGKMIDVGGYKLHIKCAGSGAPSVIIAAGGGEFSLSWFAVQDEIAKFTHVCTYDRGSSGWSEESTVPLTGSHIISELHTLLANADVPKPYILVGHSSGGAYMQLYANTYPDDIYGVVLVDSSHALQVNQEKELRKEKSPTGGESMPFMERMLHTITNSWIGQYTGLRRLHMLITHNEFFHWKPKPLQDALKARTLARSSFRSNENFVEMLDQLAATENRLGDKPLIVITAGKTPEENHCSQEFITRIWLPLQKDLVAKSSKGTQIIAEKSGHMIHYDQPEIIVQAVRDMVAQYHAETK
jgi:pimeloyl-ACP methyl ester carboxylesterase